MKYPVSTATKRYLGKINSCCIGYCSDDRLEIVYDACFPHKRNIDNAEKWAAVLNALDRERKAGCKLFEKGFYLTPSSRWARIFTLKDDKNLFNEVRNVD